MSGKSMSMALLAALCVTGVTFGAASSLVSSGSSSPPSGGPASWTGNPPATYSNGGVTWTGVGQWNTDPGGNGWPCGNQATGVGGPAWTVIRMQAGQGGSTAGYGAMSAPLGGYNTATLSNRFVWCNYQGTYANGQQSYPNPGHPNAAVGTGLLSMELNGVGVAMTIISYSKDTAGMFDFNGVDLSNNPTSFPNTASNIYYSGYNVNDLLLQIMQYDNVGGVPTHFKVLDTFDLAQWGTMFRTNASGSGNTRANWSADYDNTDSLTINPDGSVSASFFNQTTGNTHTYNSSAPLAPLGGTIGSQAIWGSGSYAFKSGLDSVTGEFYATLTADAVPEPATVGLLALGGVALLRRRRYEGDASHA